MTLRELAWMADGKRKHDWSQAAMVAAVIANCHRDPKRQRRPYHPDDFNPMTPRRPKPMLTPIDLAMALGVPVTEEQRRKAAEKYGVRNGQ